MTWWDRFVAWQLRMLGLRHEPEWVVEVCGGVLAGHDVGGFIEWMVAEASVAAVVRARGGLQVRTADWPGKRPKVVGRAAYKKRVLGLKRQPGAAPHIYLRRAGHELAHMIEGYTHDTTNHRRRWRAYYITLGEDLGILDERVAERLRARDATEHEIEKAWDRALVDKNMVRRWKVGPRSLFTYCSERDDL